MVFTSAEEGLNMLVEDQAKGQEAKRKSKDIYGCGERGLEES